MLVYRVLERFAYYGVGANLVNFMTTQLNKDVVSSITSFNNWSGLATLTPILGAYIADTYTGRFWTITFSLLIYAIVSCSFIKSCVHTVFSILRTYTFMSDVRN